MSFFSYSNTQLKNNDTQSTKHLPQKSPDPQRKNYRTLGSQLVSGFFQASEGIVIHSCIAFATVVFPFANCEGPVVTVDHVRKVERAEAARVFTFSEHG